MEIPSSRDRVPKHTSAEINEEIRRKTRRSIERYQNASAQDIEGRLNELDQEWDIERAIEANASTVSLLGLTLAATVSRRWLALPFAVGGFLLQHSIQGWCPPVPVLRRLGFRTSQEIEEERYALKILRGDFDELVTVRKEQRGVDEIYREVTH